ncbi:MAG: phosphoribosylanthranilate isomerase [Archaeoglobaceae archaeon]|nr:phosphoribosylanthranilate isomerase [Archaeoglobaceae archaeon]MCX8152675.1 phosphoribosylanthranilate isomerase [Archaeoglobaceae archaeon]MDW8013676.1 phosphoribosylanthranilate isomerase [Archaeoglobaceae archaeon]
MFVKICGIKSFEELRTVEKYADATGVIVRTESKRRIGEDLAKEIIENSKIPVFLVSTLKNFEDWREVISYCKPEWIQIHAKVDKDLVEKIRSIFGVSIALVFEVPTISSNPFEDAEKIIKAARNFNADLTILDSGRGSGKLHDLRVSKLVAEEIDIVLAGGLNPENVAEVVKFVKPYGVDVSSGVEKEGKKDEDLVKLFLEKLGVKKSLFR